MKKYLVFFATFLFVFSFHSVSITHADFEKEYFAKVQSNGVNFYASPTESSALFEIPFSYFVKVKAVVDNYFKVTYMDLEGYVKKDKVDLMDGSPINPYANANFNLYLPFALYETASKDNALTNLDENMTICYYGKKVGQQLKIGINDWYYSRVQVEGTTLHGYVYSDLVETPINIKTNNEVFSKVTEDILFPSNSTFKGLSTGTKVILIVAISVPSILILYFLIKPSKIMEITKMKKKQKQPVRRIRHGDYFEFDESEL